MGHLTEHLFGRGAPVRRAHSNVQDQVQTAHNVTPIGYS